MGLRAILTWGWEDYSQYDTGGLNLHQRAESAPEGYAQSLIHQLKQSAAPPTVYGVERLFRKRAEYFRKTKKFLSALLDIACSEPELSTIDCHIDVFVYAFLSGAKNFDFFLQCDTSRSGPFHNAARDIARTLHALEEFERRGEPLPGGLPVSREQYLALRRIVSRPSARDERRALATLLISGPSTMDDVGQDLGLHYTLSLRTLDVFREHGVVEKRDDGVFAITKPALAMVVFVLRETMGIDLLKPYLPTEG